MTCPNTNNTSLQMKAQDLQEMYLYGQITLQELIAQCITLGLETGKSIFNEVMGVTL